jgi:hypothetical protein
MPSMGASHLQATFTLCIFNRNKKILTRTIQGKCEVCTKILLLFKTPLHKHEKFELGTLEYVLSLPCKSHRRLLAELFKINHYPNINQSPLKRVRVYREDDFKISFALYNASDKASISSGYFAC